MYACKGYCSITRLRAGMKLRLDYAEMQKWTLRGKAGRLRVSSDRRSSIYRENSLWNGYWAGLGWEGYYCRNLDFAALAVKGLSPVFH